MFNKKSKEEKELEKQKKLEEKQAKKEKAEAKAKLAAEKQKKYKEKAVPAPKVKETVNLSKDKDSKYIKVSQKLLVIITSVNVAVLLAFIAMLIILIGVVKNKDAVKSETESVDSTEITTSFSEVTLKKKEITTVKDALIAQLDDIISKNAYIQVYSSDDAYDTYIYNAKGEIFGQGSDTNYMTVFRKDGTAIRYTDSISVGQDIDILSLSRNVLNLIGKDDVEIKQVKNDDVSPDEMGYNEYAVYVKSWDAIRDIYSPVSDEFADTMVSSIQDSMGEDWDPCFKFYFAAGLDEDNGSFSVTCDLIDKDGKEYINWRFDGYLLVYDWELTEDWYTYDFSDADTSEDMLTDLVGKLGAMMKQYAEDNGIDTSAEDTVESTEDAVEETTEAVESTEEATEALEGTEESSLDSLENLDDFVDNNKVNNTETE